MKKNMYFMLTMTFILSVNLFANPAAIDFNKLSKDSKLKELSNDFLEVYNSICFPDYMHKDEKSDDLLVANNLFEYLSKKTKTNYDDQLLKLLAMRCLYNFDEITQDQMKETFNFLEEKYSKKAEHHWIYGNYLASTGLSIKGKNELEKYLNMKKNRVNESFLNDYSYSQFLCATPLKAYYTLTNGGSIPEENIANQNLLNILKQKIKESSWSETYEVKDVWKISAPDSDNLNYLYSTMLGVSLPVKGHWNLRFMPINSKAPTMINLGIRDFTLNDLPLGISILFLIYPESIYTDDTEESLKKSLNIIKTETVKIDNKKFTKYTYEDLSKYNDDRQGALGYLYTAKIMPGATFGAKCEHDIDIASIMKNSENNSKEKFFRIEPAQKRLNEPVNIFILVDSCNVIANETQQLLDEIFSKTVFE